MPNATPSCATFSIAWLNTAATSWPSSIPSSAGTLRSSASSNFLKVHTSLESFTLFGASGHAYRRVTRDLDLPSCSRIQSGTLGDSFSCTNVLVDNSGQKMSGNPFTHRASYTLSGDNCHKTQDIR